MRNPGAKFAFLMERHRLQKSLLEGCHPDVTAAQAARVHQEARRLGLLTVKAETKEGGKTTEQVWLS